MYLRVTRNASRMREHSTQTQPTNPLGVHIMTATQTTIAQPINATVVANGVEVIKQGKPVQPKQPKQPKTKGKDAGSAAFANMTKQTSNTMVSVGGSNSEPE